jgi:hypothetical protein
MNTTLATMIQFHQANGSVLWPRYLPGFHIT